MGLIVESSDLSTDATDETVNRLRVGAHPPALVVVTGIFPTKSVRLQRQW